MKRTLLTLFLILAPLAGQAQENTTQYIRDTLYVTLRAEPDSQSDVIRSGLTSGTALTIVDQTDDGDYSLVRTTDGAQGWMQSQYLSEDPAARDLLEEVSTSLDQVQSEKIQLEVSLEETSQLLQQSESALTEITAQFNEQQLAFEELQEVSGNAMELNDQLKQVQLANQRLTTEMEAMQIKYDSMEAELSNSSFWKGAIAVLIGMVLTFIIALFWPKRKSEWV